MPAKNGFSAFSVFVLQKTFAPFAVRKTLPARRRYLSTEY
jgi:hypothetical protein